MLTTVHTRPALHQRAKQMIVAALLSLGIGLAVWPPHTPIIKGLDAVSPTVCRITWWGETQESNTTITELPCVEG